MNAKLFNTNLKSLPLLILLGCWFVLFVFGKCEKDEDPNNDDDDMVMVDDSTDTVIFDDTLRFANFNASMFRNSEGSLINELSGNDSGKTQKVAEIIQRTRPDVLALMEFDYDVANEALNLFQLNYLQESQNGADTIQYQYSYAVASNTGVLAEIDIDGNGTVSLPNDAYGFGNFPGQYAFAILSKYPLDLDNIRSFREFLWKDMPNALLPEKANGESYYSEEALSVFRLSSKNHVDIPVKLPNDETVHVLLSHPTPPVFDGAEDRNGKRNHDEIRLFADYISNAAYIVDDNNTSGGLNNDDYFVVMGDLNADPVDGDSYDGAINQLLEHPNVNADVALGSLIPSSEGGAEHNQGAGDTADPTYDTSFFGLRTDYVLPSKNFQVIETGVFWPNTADNLSYLVANEASSDHVLVWVDVKF